ncbi:lectin C-type domain protein [Oesophagostomum dentatum]|uniref:Lectin C-type domain protein n=1 Tax=Oesophagostomum dentatum TaxID=61180 RepID=A0A0B1TFZ6_OESDE|nr:lectin C-type domain protein [Oesophagostomum dentatum]
MILVCISRTPCSAWHINYNNGHCYMKFCETLHRDDAETNCEAVGARLAAIHSQETNYFIAGLALMSAHDGKPDRQRVWIGAKRHHRGGPFYWPDGSSMNYSNWDSRNPSNHCDLDTVDCEMCVELGQAEWRTWNDYPCAHWTSSFQYICERTNCKFDETPY